MQAIYLALAAGLGLGAAIGAAAYALSGLLFEKRRDGLSERFKARVKPVPVMPVKAGKREFPFRLFFFSIAGALLLGLATWGSAVSFLAASLGLALGPLWEVMYKKLAEGKKKFIRLREVAVLYEGVDLFTRAGFTVRQSLQLSLPLVPGLKQEIMRCLDRWPAGPLRAIQMLGEDIGLEEADVLTGVLMHAEEQGPGKVSGIMEQEAVRLEGLRQALAEMRVASKPVYSTIYTFMPVIAALGMLVAPLAFRAIQTIASIRAGQ